MARLGTAVRRWTQTRSRSATGGAIRTDIALNKDKKLLCKHSWLKHDGRLDFTDGWKLVARRINDDQTIHKHLTEKGYVEVEVEVYAD